MDHATNKCVSSCKEGQYGYGGECLFCPEECKNCSDDSMCTGCFLNKTVTKNGKCENFCETG